MDAFHSDDKFTKTQNQYKNGEMSAERFLSAQVGVTSLNMEWEDDYLAQFYSELDEVLETDCSSEQAYEENFDSIKRELVRDVDKVDDITRLCRNYRGEHL